MKKPPPTPSNGALIHGALIHGALGPDYFSNGALIQGQTRY